MPSDVTRSKIANDICIIHDTKEQYDTVENALKKIQNDGNGAGASLLSKIYRNCGRHQDVYIGLTSEDSFTIPMLTDAQLKEHEIEHNIPGDAMTPRHNAAARLLSQKNDEGKYGSGTNAFILWRPDEYHYIHKRGRPSMDSNSNLGFITLAHELVHACRRLKGNATNSRMTEEKRAVGIGRFSDAEVSENAIRREHGLPIRQRYTGLDDPDGSDSPQTGSDYY